MKKRILLAAMLTTSFVSLPGMADVTSYGSAGIGAVYSNNLIATGINRYPWNNAPDGESLDRNLRQNNDHSVSARLAELRSDLGGGDSGETGTRAQGSRFVSDFSEIQLLAAP